MSHNKYISDSYEQLSKYVTASPHITESYLEALCKEISTYNVTRISKVHSEQDWDTLLTRAGWEVQHNSRKGLVRIVDAQKMRRAIGNEEKLLRPMLEYAAEQEKIARLQKSNRLKYGIVFCGGGAKGAYQIGVWKRLCEMGVDGAITGVSGASVGALNSLLFVASDYEQAVNVWRGIRSGDLMPVSQSIQSLFNLTMSLLLPDVIKNVRLLNADWGQSASLFTQERLRDIIYDNASKEKVCNTDKLVYNSLTAWTGPRLPRKDKSVLNTVFRIEYPCWESLDYQQIINTVLASAALPVAYPQSEIGRNRYIDGGVLDNCPIRPLMKAGFEHIIAVHLNPKSDKEVDKTEKCIKDLSELTTNIHHIWPSASLGGTLEVTPEQTTMRMDLGYQDAIEQLRGIFD